MDVNLDKKKSKNANLHAGHRQRVFQKYINHGLSAYAEHEVLEMILFYSIPMKDTNELAHKIIDEFGSLENVLNASPEELMAISGVGERTAILLSLFRALREYENTTLYDKRIYFRNIYDIGKFCYKYFEEHIYESAILLVMDAQARLKKVKVLSNGTINETAFYASEIMKTCLNLRSPAVVIAHNHPEGMPNPSSADMVLTEELYRLLKSVHIDLLDHIICNEDHFVSLRERGIFDNFKDNGNDNCNDNS